MCAFNSGQLTEQDISPLLIFPFPFICCQSQLAFEPNISIQRPIFDNFALKFQALKNGPRKVKILVQVPQTQISNWVKDPSLQDGWFGQGESLSEGEVGTFRALFSRPAAFDPYTSWPWFTAGQENFQKCMSAGIFKEKCI